MRAAQFCIGMILLGIALSGCYRCADEMWDDSQSAHRYMTRGFRTLGGKHGSSRAVVCRDDFQDQMMYEDFIPLQDQPGMDGFAMGANIVQQPREVPGDPGSAIPGIQAFYD